MLDANERLNHVENGMTVIDSNGDEIGEVEYFEFGSEGAAETAWTATDADTLLENFANAINTEPETEAYAELRARLEQHGFIRIERGILQSDGYVMAEQVAHVHDNHVHLNITKDKVIKF